MKQHKQNIIEVITSVYESGMNIPEYYFQKQFNEFKDSLRECEIVPVLPIYFVKPVGVEFNYTVFWNGRKFRGGYVTVHNNYIGIGRGHELLKNGSTMFASHVQMFKKALKKLVDENSYWLSVDGVLTETGVVFWGYGDVDTELIEKLTGESIDSLEEKFLSDEKNEFPEGFAARCMIYGTEFLFITEKSDKSITKAWKAIYDKASMLKKDFWYLEGLDNFMRKGYSKLMSSGEL